MGDLVAIFHASFHPTRGNVIDWSVTASGDFNLDNLEFSALPSGLHLVEQDIVYFSKDGHQGVCAFRRVKSTEDGHRGFRLSSLGVLLAKSTRPKPWRHVAALKDLMVMLYARMELTETLQPSETDWQPSRMYFESHESKSVDLGGAGDWCGWSHELDGENRDRSNINPTLHLPHLLRILGPSTLTLYKHVIGRKRTLIYTLPPVEAACILCHVAADFCYEQQVDTTSNRLPGKSKEGIQVLGMITLSDIDRLQAESKSGRGWIACTTDALFLERPSYYDLLIDLTTSTPNKATRPTFYSSEPILPTSRGPTHRLSTVRFAWSDVKLWNELDRILQLDSSNSHSSNFSCCTPGFSDVSDQKLGLITAWTDVWRVYEDVCLVCASLWIGSWRGNSIQSYSTSNGAENWGSIRLEGDDDLTLSTIAGNSERAQIRSLGAGIEGRPLVSLPTNKPMRKTSGMFLGSGQNNRARTSGTATRNSNTPQSSNTDAEVDQADAELLSSMESEREEMQLRTTLALLQTFHAHTSFQLSILESLLPPPSERSNNTINLVPKDILAFELGPFSSVDERYLEWLVTEYGGGTTLLIKRSWKDLLGVVFGYGC
ncbi:hypothetical protein F5876DRAFT_76333 [Lentinula aff. lateritia]|uniref:Uncharacterized protein n=1 Tax=Lentinula aff. lateritia TaxID=2804960 RepID=A0ACC1U1L2_9AGAR|nr:hypothetical protein F5876DRAFT_76333 [Lentinula aff. lateritia]